MASLVADYGSDDDSPSDYASKIMMKKDTLQPSRNFLIADDEDDSSDSFDSEEEKCQSNTKTLPSVSVSLPRPAFTEPSSDVISPRPSIFANPFELAAKAKQAILEKHVKMTEKIVTNSSKPVCKKFKRGSCYFGDKCRFSHDISSNIVSVPPDVETASVISKNTNRYNRTREAVPIDPQDDDSYMANAKRKKRVGMTDALVPPKRSLLALNKQRQQDRPWTINKK